MVREMVMVMKLRMMKVKTALSRMNLQRIIKRNVITLITLMLSGSSRRVKYLSRKKV